MSFSQFLWQIIQQCDGSTPDRGCYIFSYEQKTCRSSTNIDYRIESSIYTFKLFFWFIDHIFVCMKKLFLQNPPVSVLPLSPRDDHGFSPLHWACREGRSNVVDMLIMRGARINVMNRGDDTPLHLAASHGHRDIVAKVRPWRHSHSTFKAGMPKK